MLVFGLALFGTIAIQPLLMEQLLGYPVATAGLVMAPRGFGAALGMLIVARLAQRVDPRWVILAGMTLAGSATWIMSWYNLDISPGWLIWPSALAGVGMGAVFVTLSSLAYATLAPEHTDAGAGLYNLARSIGSSIGISIAATWYSRFGQADWNQLGGHLNPFNPALRQWLQDSGTAPERSLDGGGADQRAEPPVRDARLHPGVLPDRAHLRADAAVAASAQASAPQSTGGIGQRGRTAEMNAPSFAGQRPVRRLGQYCHRRRCATAATSRYIICSRRQGDESLNMKSPR